MVDELLELSIALHYLELDAQGVSLIHKDDGILRLEYDNAASASHWYILDPLHGLCYTDFIYVTPELRQQGVGLTMLRVQEEICKEQGIDMIVLGENNLAPVFWKEMGYFPLEKVISGSEAKALIGREYAWDAAYAKRLTDHVPVSQAALEGSHTEHS